MIKMSWKLNWKIYPQYEKTGLQTDIKYVYVHINITGREQKIDDKKEKHYLQGITEHFIYAIYENIYNIFHICNSLICDY